MKAKLSTIQEMANVIEMEQLIELDEAGVEIHRGCGGLVFLLESGTYYCLNCGGHWDEDGECDGKSNSN